MANTIIDSAQCLLTTNIAYLSLLFSSKGLLDPLTIPHKSSFIVLCDITLSMLGSLSQLMEQVTIFISAMIKLCEKLEVIKFRRQVSEELLWPAIN